MENQQDKKKLGNQGNQSDLNKEEQTGQRQSNTGDSRSGGNFGGHQERGAQGNIGGSQSGSNVGGSRPGGNPNVGGVRREGEGQGTSERAGGQKVQGRDQTNINKPQGSFGKTTEEEEE